MTTMLFRWTRGLTALLAGALVAGSVAAQTFPQRPIEVVVGYPPGASLDILARLMQPHMAAFLGQQVVVDNRAGAGGNIGTSSVARSAPDGYRILLASNANLTINPHVYKDPGFDVFDDLEPITQLATGPVAIVVNRELNIDSLEQLLELARQNPGKVSYGTPGIGSPMHLLGEMLSQETGVQLNHVPYKGSVPALNDLIGGSINVAISTLATITPFLETGKLKVIALAEAEPFALNPDIPLIKDTVPGLTSPAWFAFVAPKGTPKEVIDKLHAASVAALENESVRKGLEVGAMVPLAEGPEGLAQLMREEYDLFGRVVQERNISPN